MIVLKRKLLQAKAGMMITLKFFTAAHTVKVEKLFHGVCGMPPAGGDEVFI